MKLLMHDVMHFFLHMNFHMRPSVWLRLHVITAKIRDVTLPAVFLFVMRYTVRSYG